MKTADSEHDGMIAAVSMVLHGRSLDIPSTPHPNKMPFSGVLTFLDESSDGSPDGANGQRVMITSQAASKDNLDSLLGMAVDYTPDWDGHDPQNKIGVITASEIKDIDGKKAIWVAGYIYAADFPEAAKEIKDNKDELGMSFEARNLWTTDPKADPIPIYDCVFTGAAILLKDKAAYRSTSINAAAKAAPSSSKEFIIMDENTKKELTEMLAAALKPVADAVSAQGVKISELEKLPESIVKVQAANHLSKVEKHASELEKAADHMDAAGIGGHPTNGHVAVLRKMAGSMRAEAAEGKIPHSFYSFSAVDAAPKTDDAALKSAVETVKAEFAKQIEEVKASAEKNEKSLKDELASTKTVLADIQAKATREAPAPERKTLAPMHATLLAKSSLKPSDETGKINVDDVNSFLAKSGLSPEKRIEFKSGLHQAGLID